MAVLRLPISGNPKIGDPSIAVLIQNDVLRLNVAMDDVPLMEMVETLNQAPD